MLRKAIEPCIKLASLKSNMDMHPQEEIRPGWEGCTCPIGTHDPATQPQRLGQSRGEYGWFIYNGFIEMFRYDRKDSLLCIR